MANIIIWVSIPFLGAILGYTYYRYKTIKETSMMITQAAETIMKQEQTFKINGKVIDLRGDVKKSIPKLPKVEGIAEEKKQKSILDRFFGKKKEVEVNLPFIKKKYKEYPEPQVKEKIDGEKTKTKTQGRKAKKNIKKRKDKK